MKYLLTLPKLIKQKNYTSFHGGKWCEFNYQNGGYDDGMTTGWSVEERKGKDVKIMLAKIEKWKKERDV